MQNYSILSIPHFVILKRKKKQQTLQYNTNLKFKAFTGLRPWSSTGVLKSKQGNFSRN